MKFKGDDQFRFTEDELKSIGEEPNKKQKQRRTIIVACSSPNTTKPPVVKYLSFSHLRQEAFNIDSFMDYLYRDWPNIFPDKPFPHIEKIILSNPTTRKHTQPRLPELPISTLLYHDYLYPSRTSTPTKTLPVSKMWIPQSRAPRKKKGKIINFFKKILGISKGT